MAADIATMDQGLLRKNPTLTEKEFSDHWYHKHSQLVIPFFLHSGVKHYEQIHGPITLINKSSSNKITPAPSQRHQQQINLTSISGVCALPPQRILDEMKLPRWKQAYYDEIIKADERRFLEGEALDVFIRVGPNSVKGDRRVVIEDGKPLVEVGEDVWRVWRDYEARAEAEEAEATAKKTTEAKES